MSVWEGVVVTPLERAYERPPDRKEGEDEGESDDGGTGAAGGGGGDGDGGGGEEELETQSGGPQDSMETGD